MPTGKGLQSEKVELAVGIALRRPVRPELVGLGVDFLVATGCARNNAGAYDIVDERRDRLSGMRVVAHEVAHAVAEQGAGDGDLGVGRCGGRSPAIGATAFCSAVITARNRLKALAGKNAL